MRYLLLACCLFTVGCVDLNPVAPAPVPTHVEYVHPETDWTFSPPCPNKDWIYVGCPQ